MEDIFLNAIQAGGEILLPVRGKTGFGYGRKVAMMLEFWEWP